MLSMTGYGSAAVQRDQREVTAEIRTVNHRFLDLSVKLPKGFLKWEDAVRRQVSQKLSRGHADIFVTYRNRREDAVQVELNAPLLKQYVAAVDQMAADGLPPGTALPDASYYASLPGVLTEQSAPDDEDEVAALLREALEEALRGVGEMRAREGEALKKDLGAHLSALKGLHALMEEPAREAPALYARQLAARLNQLGASVSEERLSQEVALFADRAAVDEELSRLSSHIAQMEKLLDSPGPVGKKLDFLLQEMNREVNTIASKSPSLALTDLAVNAKNEIEKLREQAQNVE